MVISGIHHLLAVFLFWVGYFLGVSVLEHFPSLQYSRKLKMFGTNPALPLPAEHPHLWWLCSVQVQIY